jgi:tetratricopeptide (TPR) repeat protein
LELSGGFIEIAQQNGWFRLPHRLVLTANERAILFRLRWTELTELGNVHPFRPTLDDWRIYYRFLLQHPEGPDASEVADARAQLAYVAALEKRDSEYPALLARGILYSKLGAYASAIEALETHLASHPRGAWRLRAQNYLAYALEQAAATSGSELPWR